MKCFVLLTFATLCYSYPYGSGYGYGSGSGGNININQDGSVYITDANGRKLTVSRGPQQNNGAITLTGYERYNRNYWYQPSQADALVRILAQYQGDVNENSYQQLLGDVRAAVQAGQLSNNVYQLLQNLNQAQNWAGESQRIQVSFASNPFQNQAGQSGAQERLQELRQAQQIQQLIQQEQQVQQLLQQQQQQQQRNQYVQNQQGRFGVQGQADAYLGAGNQGVYGQQQIGKDVGVARSWSAFITDILNGNRQQNVGQYNRYGQQIGQSVSNQLSQIAEEERKILVQQDQIQEQQLQQQQQQQQLLEQQLEQQQQQQQQQNQQQDIEELQQQVQQEQEQVLNQQQRLQQEQEQQQQQLQQQQQQLRQQQRQRQQLQQQLQQEQQLRNLLNGPRVFIGNQGQSSFWQQQPGVYSQRGKYGVNGQVFQRQYAPLVF